MSYISHQGDSTWTLLSVAYKRSSESIPSGGDFREERECAEREEDNFIVCAVVNHTECLWLSRMRSAPGRSMQCYEKSYTRPELKGKPNVL